MMKEIKVSIIGALGRMGHELVNAVISAQQTKELKLVAAVVRPSSEFIGKAVDSTNVTYSSDIIRAVQLCDVVIDFTNPSTSIEVARIVADHKKVYICGTTGFSEAEIHILQELAKKTVLFHSPNMSVAIYVLANLVEKAAMLLPKSFDIEVLDVHHKHKTDAPSGTALMLGEFAANGRSLDLASSKIFDRNSRAGARKEGEIGFSSMRCGGIIGRHSVTFASEAEEVTLSHAMYDRAIYAQNSVKIALWAAQLPPGKLYSMLDYIN